MSPNSEGSVVKPPLSYEMLEKIIIKGLVLFLLALAVYIPVRNGGYIYDDDTLLYNNPAIRSGEGGWNAQAWKGLWALWYPVGNNAAVSADYAPLASTTYWLEFRLWGNNGDVNGPDPDTKVWGIGSPGYHITNVVLHGVACLLLWYLLAEIGVPGAWVAALVWAVHPVGAESVAWIAERRNPLSMALFLLTMINWFRFQRTGRRRAYWLAVALFVLTMLAKTSIVMLPVLLLLCVWWERGWTIQVPRRQGLLFLAAQAVAVSWCACGYFLGRMAWPLGLAGFVVVVTPPLGWLFAWLYKRLEPTWRGIVHFQAAMFVFLLWCAAFIFILVCVNEDGHGPLDMSWPVGLAVFALLITPPAVYSIKLLYDRFGPIWRQVLPFFMISLVFGIITIYFQNFRAVGKEWLPIVPPLERIPGACFALGFYFCKILCPWKLNLIYQQWHRILPHAGASPESILFALNTQRFTHIPVPYSITGLAKELIIGVDFAAFFYWAWRRRATWGRHAIFGLGFFVIMIAPVLGFTRMAYMRLTLVADHFQYVPMVGVIALCVAGLVEVHKRIELPYKYALVVVGAGVIALFCRLTWERAGVFSDPKRLWVDNVTKNPDSWQGHSHLGAVYWSTPGGHDVAAALEEWQKSVELAPYLFETHNNYALALEQSGRLGEALKQFKRAVEIDGDQFKVRRNYADALSLAGLQAQTDQQAEKAAEYFQESIEQYRIVLTQDPISDPELPSVFNKMGQVFAAMRDFDAAEECFQYALKFDPGNAAARQNIEVERRASQEASQNATLDTRSPDSPEPAAPSTKTKH